MASNEGMSEWLKQDSRFIKLQPGDQYKAVFQGMAFDKTGGFKGKPCVRYQLKDTEDGKIREMSSSSKALAQEMMKLLVGDTIVLTCGSSKTGTKSYEVLVLSKAQNTGAEGVQPELLQDEEESDQTEIPF